MLTERKLAAAMKLSAALLEATETGLFDDEIPAWVLSPATINDFCDAVQAVLDTHDSELAAQS